jgi:PAS domain S-box-containing protein
MSLSSRIFAGFLLLTAVFSLSGVVAVQALQGARRDLVVLTRGYLALGRTATQLRTLQEVYDHNVARAVAEPNRLRRTELSAFARELYPQSMGAALEELQTLARQLQQARVSPSDALFLENVFAQARRARALALAYDEATSQLLDSLDDPDGLDDDGVAVDRQAAVETWRKGSEQASRDLRTIALGVDARAVDALLRIEKAEEQSVRAIVIAGVTALAIAALILWMMLRALSPLRALAQATRAMQAGHGTDAVFAVIDDHVRGDAEVAALAEELVGLARSLEERGAVLAHKTEELRRLSAFAENVIRSVRVGIVVVDERGRIRSINPAARAVFSLPLRDVEGHHLAEAGDAFGAAVAVIDAVRATGEPRALPGLKLGDKVVDVTVVPMRDRAGSQASEVLLLGDDVTAREDARERLVHSERLAAIGRLAAQITHEIRNPLSSIGLNIELLGDDVAALPGDRQAEVQSILDAVLSEVRRLAEITEGYLRFARLPTHQKQHRDVGDLCADLVAFFQSEASARGVNVELHVDDVVPPVVIDSDRLRQALLNLLRNAVDAAGSGGTVRISARAHDLGGHERGVWVIVEDNGPGVVETCREQIFSPFFTTKAEGTGLGLVVAREIVREHGGDLTVGDSALGGAAFQLRLPVADDVDC